MVTFPDPKWRTHSNPQDPLAEIGAAIKGNGNNSTLKKLNHIKAIKMVQQ